MKTLLECILNMAWQDLFWSFVTIMLIIGAIGFVTLLLEALINTVEDFIRR